MEYINQNFNFNLFNRKSEFSPNLLFTFYSGLIKTHTDYSFLFLIHHFSEIVGRTSVIAGMQFHFTKFKSLLLQNKLANNRQHDVWLKDVINGYYG